MAVAMLHAYKNISSTDRVCKWSRPKSSATDVHTVAEMYPETLPTATLDRAVSEADRSSFLTSLLQCNPHCGLTWLLTSEPPEPPAETCKVPTVPEVIHLLSYTTNITDVQVDELLSKLSVSKDQITFVESNTRGQQQNPLWGQYRSGRLTASNFGKVLMCMDGKRKPSLSLLKTLLGEYDASGAKAVQWGTLHEKTAVEKYEQEKGISVELSGFWLHEQGFCGASPDGIVDDSTIVEVKCPFSLRNDNLMDHISDSFFLHVNCDNEVALN